MTRKYYFVTYRALGAEHPYRNYYSAAEKDKAEAFAASTEHNNGVVEWTARTPKEIAACEEMVAMRQAMEV